jgi:precorrin-4 methylase
MAEQPSSFQFEDVPLDEARRMSRGPRMDPQLYQELRTRIQSLSDQAVRMTITNGTSQNTMKNRILRVAAELGIPVTIRRVPGGVIFWRSSAENIEQAQEAANRLHTGRQTGKTTQPRPQARSRGRRPRGAR